MRVAARACSALADANSAEIAACLLPSVACWTLTELVSIGKLSIGSFFRSLILPNNVVVQGRESRRFVPSADPWHTLRQGRACDRQ